MNMHLKASMDLAAEGGMNVHLKGGMNVVIEAGIQLTLKAGPGFITIGPSGVAISGPMVMINSGGAAGSGGGCSPQAPGSPVAPDAPEEPQAPLEITASANAETYSGSGPPPASKAEVEWRAIETAPPNAQASALSSASEEGRPFCPL
jgi:type VI secretion system secreted protein VgrG